jgi:hypothetical protein
MEFYRFFIGSLSFQIDVENVSPNSTEANGIARDVAKALNDKLFYGVVQGTFPPYAVSAKVHTIASGSLTVDLVLHADIVAGVSLALLFKFLKDYSDVRKGVLAFAGDLRSVSLFLTKKALSVKLHASNLLQHHQVAAEIAQIERDVNVRREKEREEASERVRV